MLHLIGRNALYFLFFARHSSESWNPAFAVTPDFAPTASIRLSARIPRAGHFS
ncbi:hypothetical protein [Rudaea sp.]|uniref:hypothetical protein n=1 Tax=Rudaea sp. TaxID=2136325 RepID=UPI002ECFF71F